MGNKKSSFQSMKDKVVLITGANRGIGYHSALNFTKLGAKCIIACRNDDAGNNAVKQVQDATQSRNIEFIKVDLASFESITNFISEFERKYSRLDVMVNNAAIGFLKEPRESQDGFELQFAVNYLAPFLLTNAFVNMFQNTGNSRIINMNCKAHLMGRVTMNELEHISTHHPESYNTSKLLNMTFTNTFHAKYNCFGLNAFSLNPGLTFTNLYKGMPDQHKNFMKFGSKLGLIRSPEDACLPLVHFASCERLDPSIRYFTRFDPDLCTDFTTNEEIQEKLWEMTNNLVAKKWENANITENKD